MVRTAKIRLLSNCTGECHSGLCFLSGIWGLMDISLFQRRAWWAHVFRMNSNVCIHETMTGGKSLNWRAMPCKSLRSRFRNSVNNCPKVRISAAIQRGMCGSLVYFPWNLSINSSLLRLTASSNSAKKRTWLFDGNLGLKLLLHAKNKNE